VLIFLKNIVGFFFLVYTGYPLHAQLRRLIHRALWNIVSLWSINMEIILFWFVAQGKLKYLI